ncbi:hypothetical protein BX600DRAFT_475833, partial [Xylariales sp. PMI_506]
MSQDRDLNVDYLSEGYFCYSFNQSSSTKAKSRHASSVMNLIGYSAKIGAAAEQLCCSAPWT